MQSAKKAHKSVPRNIKSVCSLHKRAKLNWAVIFALACSKILTLSHPIHYVHSMTRNDTSVCRMQKRAIKVWLETSKVYAVCGKGPNPTEQCFSHGGHAVTFWHFHVPFRGSKSCKTALPLTESQITSTPRCALSPHINQPGFHSRIIWRIYLIRQNL